MVAAVVADTDTTTDDDKNTSTSDIEAVPVLPPAYLEVPLILLDSPHAWDAHGRAWEVIYSRGTPSASPLQTYPPHFLGPLQEASSCRPD